MSNRINIPRVSCGLEIKIFLQEVGRWNNRVNSIEIRFYLSDESALNFLFQLQLLKAFPIPNRKFELRRINMKSKLQN